MQAFDSLQRAEIVMDCELQGAEKGRHGKRPEAQGRAYLRALEEDEGRSELAVERRKVCKKDD